MMLAVLLFPPAPGESGPIPIKDDPDKWERLDIVPMPRQVELTGEGDTLALDDRIPYGVQIGAWYSGHFPSDADIDELRISRIARYATDFAALPSPFQVDGDTAALFHVDRNLDAGGMAPDGPPDKFTTTAGVRAHNQ